MENPLGITVARGRMHRSREDPAAALEIRLREAKLRFLAPEFVEETTMEVKGRDLVAGLPKTLTVTSEEIREALQEPVSSIIDAIRITLERCPPELAADLVDRGMILAGGGALLIGIDKLIAEQTGLPVHLADDPLSAVAEGTGVVLNELNFLRRTSDRL